MRKRKKPTDRETGQPDPETASDSVTEAAEQETLEAALGPVEHGELEPAEHGSALVEPAEAAVERLTGALEEQNDRYLRLAAEFDNFRKRVVRERSETWKRAQADVVRHLLESLDDMTRVVLLDPAETSAQDVVSGVELVHRKLLRSLESAGLARIGNEGERFDPNDHEAVATAPAPTDDQEDHVAAVFQVGYRFGNTLLRPARVQVFVAPSEDGGDPA